MITLRNGFLLLVWLGFSLVGFCIACDLSFVFLFSAISGVLLVIIPSVTLLRRFASKVNINQRMKTGHKTEKTKLYKEVLANEDVIENGSVKPDEV